MLAIGPGGHEEVLSFERQAESLQPLKVLTLASFVRLCGKHGFLSKNMIVDGASRRACACYSACDGCR
jgi:hypothetical protein